MDPIVIPGGVEVEIKGADVKTAGPKGELHMSLHPAISAEVLDGKILVRRKAEDTVSRSLHGLFRSKLFNMVIGVSEGWSKKLELVGVGYRVQGGSNNLTLSVGFSHTVEFKAPEGVTFTLLDNTKVTVSGIDKELVGQTAANIRAVKPPEVYKGKGIRYSGEYVRKKAGKAGKAATAK